MILYINSCVRKNSRTNELAKCLLNKLGDYEELKLNELNLCPLKEETLQKRTEFIANKNYKDESFNYAKQFAKADIIVISAPFWDFSFPAILKTYLENIYVTGIVSKYGEDGKPHGLCKAKILYYVTTSGGQFNSSFSYDYLSSLAKYCFGIKETRLIKAEMLDVVGYDSNEILKKAKEDITI